MVAVALLLLAGLAFWPPYLSKIGQAEGYTHVHAILGASWLVLLAVQPALIRAKRRAQHRLLGRAGVLVGLAFVASSAFIAHRSLARMSAEQFLREGGAVYLPLAMACIFASALALAIRWRGSTPVHARFMAATALPLLDPLFARILYFYGPPLPSEFLYQAPAFLAVIAALAALGRSLPGGSTGRRHFLWFSLGVAALLAGFFVVPRTEPWLHFAAWVREWPIR
jgi:uncharacterized membrane protein